MQDRRSFSKLLAGLIATVAVFFCAVSLFGTDSGKYNAVRVTEEDQKLDERLYEQRQAAAHSQMPSTLYASNPSVPMSPHGSERVDDIPNGIEPEQYHQALSRNPTPSNQDETADSLFREKISPVVQAQCILCHVDSSSAPYQGGRLVFVGSSEEGHEAHNLQVFADLVADEEDGPTYILRKIRGDNHSGGAQVPVDSENYPHFERFLNLLAGEQETESGTVTWQTLFDDVELREDRNVLRQAALIFAGRIPSADEYASITEIGLRQAIRNLMTGPGFHAFLIRASNDRLLTDRERTAISNLDTRPFIEFSKKITEFCEARAMGASAMEINANRRWTNAVQFAAVRAPLELIAYVAVNDLPYTEILTADYVMANPHAAEAYGANTEFDDPSDVFEFRPSRFARYYLYDNSRTFRERVPGCNRYILDPGNLALEFPHAGILNSPVFMIRYPTTATNRNRARSRWTYYHFLGFDIEKSRSRTTDPDALADRNNPTLNNSACTGCHTIMDPVAGAYQNFDEIGNYRPYDGGKNSLDRAYKRNPAGGEEFLIEAGSFEDRQTVASEGYLNAGHNSVGLRYEYLGAWSEVGLASVSVVDSNGRLVERYQVEDPSLGTCANPSNQHGGVLQLAANCMLGVPLTVPRDDVYTVEVEAWNVHNNGQFPGRLKVWVPGYIYEDGDTWYRDMLPPGFQNALAPSNDNSVQWLAEQIVDDDRFAEATVKFWWPALHGSEVTTTPPTSADADFEGRQIAAIAQDTEVSRLAAAFRSGINDGDPYNLKDLLVEMVLSDWFRAERVPDDDPVRAIALLNAGAKRLLTPTELAGKTLSVTGVQWGRQWRHPNHNPRASLDALSGNLNILYGGIDSDGIIERGRDLTAVMAAVAKSHAVELSCPIIARELYLLPDEERRLLNGISTEISPVLEISEQLDIESGSNSDMDRLLLSAPLKAGHVTVTMNLANPKSVNNEIRSVYLHRIRLKHESGLIIEELGPSELINPDTNIGQCGLASPALNYYLRLSRNCTEPVAAAFNIPTDGTYSVEIVTWADQVGDELTRLDVSIESNSQNSAGSRAIRQKLAELHLTLLDTEVDVDSEEIDTAYNFFVNVWNRNRMASVNRFYDGLACGWQSDQFFLEDFLSDFRLETESGYRWNHARVHEFWNSIDFSDSKGTARTWHVVLMSMLMDQRYLHL